MGEGDLWLPVTAKSQTPDLKRKLFKLCELLLHPTGIVTLHADVWVVGRCFRSSQQNQRCVVASVFVSELDQLPADASLLKFLIDSQV